MSGKLCYSPLVSRKSDESDSPCALDSARRRTVMLSAARIVTAIAAQDSMAYKMPVFLSTAEEVLAGPCYAFRHPHLPSKCVANAEVLRSL